MKCPYTNLYDKKYECPVAKIKLYKELILLKNKYIKLLNEELKETISIAYTHGWGSKLYEKGVKLRNQIKEKERQIKTINKRRDK